ERRADGVRQSGLTTIVSPARRAGAWPRCLRGIQKELVDEAGNLAPAFGLRGEAALAGFRDRVELRVAVVFRFLPGAFDPPFLLEPHERGIERSLIQLQRMVGDLLEPRRQRIRILLP